MIDKIKEAYEKYYGVTTYTLDCDFVSFEAGYKVGEIEEREACIIDILNNACLSIFANNDTTLITEIINIIRARG